ncbi:inheritance of peroxisomes protein 1-domain-containing protein [Xylaria digitata]|nr:inheritance of peroxisomes protein 1-domain-containing protein [Xylaria digitata]
MDPPKFASDRIEIPRPRRVMTAPVPASISSQQSSPPASSPLQAVSSKSEDLVETLYNHPSVKIISFTTSFPALSGDNIRPGSLPPSSHLERTIAVGPFRIYRAPGSVAFLSCGSALQPILPKSQCWCIDEDNSRFILQIRRPQYWRIEVPVAHQDDALRALVLRDVFSKILLFEKTECPFKRSFTVQLPDPPETPIRKKAWTAEGKNLISSPFESDLSPPAHTPKAISRGKRATSFTRGFWSASTEVTADGEQQDESRLEGGYQPSEQGVLDPEVHEDTPSNVDLARRRLFFSREGDDHPVGTLKRTTVNPPTSSENVTQDPTAISVPSPPSIGPKVLQNPVIRTADNGSERIEVLHEETSSHLIGASCPDPFNKQVVVKEDDARELDSLHCSNEHENGASASIPRTEDKLGMETQNAQVTQGSTRVSVDTMTTQPEFMVAETQQDCLLSDQKDDDVLKSDHSNGDDGPDSFEGSGRVMPVNLARKRMTRMLSGRSFTAPPQLTLVTPNPSKSNEQAVAKEESLPQPLPTLARGHSPSASTDSFHSVQSWHSAITPPPASPRPTSSEAESVQLSPESISEVTCSQEHATTPKNTINVIVSSSVVPDSYDSPQDTPRPTRFIFDTESKEPVDSENRPRLSQLSTFEDRLRTRRQSHAGNLSISHRTLSPLPPAANLFSSSAPRQTSQSRFAAVRRLPAAIVHKTMEILLSPPSHLVNLMLQVAAKIAAGEWRGLVFGFGETGEEIPVQWDYYSDGEFSDLSDSDDYTLTTGSSNCSGSVPRTDVRQRRTRWAHNDDNDSCEVD